jgi:hypothetical protein
MKKILKFSFVVTLAITIAIMQFGEVQADTISYTVGYPGPDSYSFCYHGAWGYPWNLCVGVGITADYHDQGSTPSHYDYTRAKWVFNSNCGGFGEKFYVGFWQNDDDNEFICDPWWQINGMMYEDGYDASPYAVDGPFWLADEDPNIPWNDALNMWTQRSTYGYINFSPHASMVTGHVGQRFYFFGYILFVEITVDPWYILTAQSGPPQNVSYHF